MLFLDPDNPMDYGDPQVERLLHKKGKSFRWAIIDTNNACEVPLFGPSDVFESADQLVALFLRTPAGKASDKDPQLMFRGTHELDGGWKCAFGGMPTLQFQLWMMKASGMLLAGPWWNPVGSRAFRLRLDVMARALKADTTAPETYSALLHATIPAVRTSCQAGGIGFDIVMSEMAILAHDQTAGFGRTYDVFLDGPLS